MFVENWKDKTARPEKRIYLSAGAETGAVTGVDVTRARNYTQNADGPVHRGNLLRENVSVSADS